MISSGLMTNWLTLAATEVMGYRVIGTPCNGHRSEGAANSYGQQCDEGDVATPASPHRRPAQQYRRAHCVMVLRVENSGQRANRPATAW